ncbi:redoxin family protein [Candidatus Nitrosotenuis cloacae]|uniref:redoxin family protein n=1 Tax=Candidatus Nitrosotenuis cloacae TaxID=1603555 RepID=UPI00227FFAAA|nr:redoxin family protein [Candidatus Nitrosotenuis cloacae]
MKGEIKTAIIMVAIVVAAIGVLSAYFTSLEAQSGQGTSHADKSGFKKAPELRGITGYINADNNINEQLKGKVVLYDIWTYSCINCQRTIPYLTAWDDRYSDKGLVIVGIHSPEFEFEKDINNVEMAVEKFGIKYPVVLDNDKMIWDSFENHYWPRKYIADHEGYIRYDHIGEGAYDETEKIIQELLQERAADLGMDVAVMQPLVDIEEFEHGAKTPEIYFGYEFARGRSQLGNPEGFRPNQDVQYSIPDKLHEDNFYLDGTWKNLSDRMILTSESGKIILPYFGKEVNIVAAGRSELAIFVDGAPIASEISGTDVTGGKVATSESTLYNIVRTKEAASHVLEIDVDGPGFEIYTFTFG